MSPVDRQGGEARNHEAHVNVADLLSYFEQRGMTLTAGEVREAIDAVRCAQGRDTDAPAMADISAEREQQIADGEARADDEAAELEVLRDLRHRVIGFGDDDFAIAPWIDAHRLHKDDPYIGCPFCRDQFVSRGAEQSLAEFQDGLTRALNRHGVPAMPSWDAAIDWLAEHGAAPQGEDHEAEINRLRAGISFVRGLCTDRASYSVIDERLGELLDGETK